jgi:hypothetical protein
MKKKKKNGKALSQMPFQVKVKRLIELDHSNIILKADMTGFYFTLEKDVKILYRYICQLKRQTLLSSFN